MADYVEKYTCGTCIEFEYAGKYTKGYCKRYGSYYHNDDSCSHWEENTKVTGSSSSGGCFLSTACCEHMGFKDDCDQLVTLREFRDNYIKHQNYGDKLIQLYYNDAPAIVHAINLRNDKDQIYDNMFEKIQKIVDLIHAQKTEDAVIEYFLLVWETSKMVFPRYCSENNL